MGMESVFRVSLVLDMIDNMTSKIGGAASGVNSSMQNMQKTFGVMQQAGKIMTGTGTAITAACMGTVTSTFATQDALAEVSSLGVEDLRTLEAAAKNFSDTWAGTTKADFISASYDIKSGIASLTDEGVAQYTEFAGLTAKATKATTADMTSLFATGYGIYKGYYDDMSDLEFGEMFSAGIATAVKNYKTSGTQMADSIKTLGASATNANVPMEEQLAILGQLQATMSGSEAGTKYKAFLNAAVGAGDKLGLTFVDANNQLLSMPEIMETLRGKYGDTIDAMEKKELKEAFGTDEAIALIDLLYNNTDQLKSGIDDLKTSMDGGIDTTNKMAEAINATPAQQFEVLKQKTHNVTEELGAGLLPAVNNTLERVNGLVQKGADWVSQNQETVQTIMRIVMMLGVFLIVAGGAAALIGTLGKAASGLKGTIGLARSAMSLFNGTLLSSPIVWIIGIVLGLVAAFALCGGDVQKLGSIFSGVFSSVAGFVGNAVSSIVSYLPQFLQFGLSLVQNVIQGVTGALPGVLSAGVSLLQSLISGVVQQLPALIQTGIALVAQLLNGIASVAPQLVTAGLSAIGQLLQGILNGIPQLLSVAVQLIPMIVSGLGSAAGNLISAGIGIIGSILQGLITGIPALIGMIPELFGQIVDSVTSIDWVGVGGNLVGSIKDGFIEGFSGLVDSAKGLWSKFTGWLSGESEETNVDVATHVQGQTVSPAITAVPATTSRAAIDNTTMLGKGNAEIAALQEEVMDTSALKNAAAASSQDIMSAFKFDTTAAGNIGSDLMSDITSGIGSAAPTASAAAAESAESIMQAFNMDDIAVPEIQMPEVSAGGLQDAVSIDTAALTAGIDSASQSVSQMESGWGQMSLAAGNAMSEVKGSVNASMTDIVSTVTSKAQAAASAIKNAFANIRVTVPAPTLPHISVSYQNVGSGKATAQVPNFSVAYYAKGGILTKPTLFGLNGSEGMVGGEAGAEAVLPLATLWTKMRQVVSDVVANKIRKDPDVKHITEQKARSIEKDAISPNKGSQKQNDRGIIIQNLSIKVSPEDLEDLDKVKKLIRQLEEDIDPQPAFA